MELREPGREKLLSNFQRRKATSADAKIITTVMMATREVVISAK